MSSTSTPSSYKSWLLVPFHLLRNALRSTNSSPTAVLPFSDFLKHASEGNLAEVLMSYDTFHVKTRGVLDGVPTLYKTQVIPHVDRQWIVEMLSNKGTAFGRLPSSVSRRITTVLLGLVPFIYLALVYKLMSKLYSPSDSVGKKHIIASSKKRRVLFSDVAGIDQAKLELAEVVDFLRNRSRFSEIGARLPKGILLSGPPGTGKTLLAKAVANEAGVPFISCSASDFVEMLVGRGAARVRDLFQRGLSAAPCIIFIDELDALAKTRGSFSSNDEREQTLNQLLTEMDGFDATENNVLVIAATNRPEVLDSALIRPGRFDRHVSVGFPDTRGRRAILEVHIRNIRVAPGLNVQRLASMTKGYSGAELANVVNEAALLAVRAGATAVGMTFFEAAVERNNEARTFSVVSLNNSPSKFNNYPMDGQNNSRNNNDSPL